MRKYVRMAISCLTRIGAMVLFSILTIMALISMAAIVVSINTFIKIGNNLKKL